MLTRSHVCSLRLWIVILAGLFPRLSFSQPDVLTYHNDNMRTGQNLSESILTPANVKSSTFGKLFTLAVDGKVDAQPLYANAVAIPGAGTPNVLYVATEHGSVYAFNADTGAPIWQLSLLGAGESPSDSRNCGQVTPEIGVTATPVIDRSAGPHGTIYVVAMSKDSSSKYHQRLHALDMATKADQFGGPVEIQATYPGTGDNSIGGSVVFDPGQYKSRPGLLLLNGVVYTSWSSHCDIRPYTGWTIGYDRLTLAQTSVFNFAPNGSEASIWSSGAGPAADSSGNLFFNVANGTFDTALNAQGFPSKGDYGNALLKLSLSNGKLVASDYWTMYNTVSESNADQDLGSGGILLLPDVVDSNGKTRHLAAAAGKDKNLYIVDRDNMGKFNPSNNSNIYQEIPSALAGGQFGMGAWFNGSFYIGGVGDVIRQFKVTAALFGTTPASTSSHSFAYPGTTPSISANGTTTGILWAAENSNPAILRAYDATNLATELYNSTQAANNRDQFGAGNKFITPTIANGKVYVGTTSGVGVFGLLAQPQTITFAPLPNRTLGSGSFTVSATASSGLPVSFASLTTPVCTVSGSTVTLVATGQCTIQASQAGNGSYAPAPNVNQSFQVTSASTGQPFITGQTPGSVRNNFTGFLGMQFTVGPSAISVTSVGRIFVSGNSGSHVVKLVNAATGADVPGGSATVTMTSASPNTYEYTALASPVTLAANTTYWLVSQETAGGDQWYDYSPVTPTSAGTVNGPVYQSGSGYFLVQVTPSNYSYVPPNFLYTASTTPPPTVSLTAPAANATISGKSVTLSATASAASGLTITCVQFKVDGNAISGGTATTPPYQATLDSTILADGQHTLTAVATDSSGNSATSAPVTVNVSNGGGPSGSPFVTGITPANLRNNYTGFVGLRFTVGAQSVTVNALGRIFVSGNTGTHTVKLVNASTSADVPGGSVSLNMSSGLANQFKYAALPSPIVLAANTSYYLVSQETAGGDQWYDVGPVAHTNVAAVNGSIYSTGSSYVLVAQPETSYVPVSFLYGGSSTAAPTVTVTSPPAGPASGVVTFSASATAASGLQVISLQLQVDGNNFGTPNTTPGASITTSANLNTATLTNGSHTLTAVARDSANNTGTSAPVVINVSNGTPPPGAPFITAQTFGGIRNNYSGFLGMKFTTGATALTVTSLGRICAPGNSGTHTLKLVQANDADLPGGSTSVSMSGCTQGQYKYAALNSPVTLAANTTYDLVSQEVNGGDQWYDYGPVTPAAGAGTVNGPVYYSGTAFVLVPSPGYAYVPVNFQYSGPAGQPPSVTITAPAPGPVSGTITITANATAAKGQTIQNVQFKQNSTNIGAPVTGAGPNYSVQLDTTTLSNGSTVNLTAVATDSANTQGTSNPVTVTVNNGGSTGNPLITSQTFGRIRNDFTGFVGMQFTTAGTAISVKSLGRVCVAGNSATHLLKLVTANGTDVPGGSVSIGMAGCTAGQYKFGALSSLVTLSANTTYILVSQEQLSGDQWYDYAPVTPASVATVNGPVYNANGYNLVPSPGYSYVPVNLLYQ